MNGTITKKTDSEIINILQNIRSRIIFCETEKDSIAVLCKYLRDPLSVDEYNLKRSIFTIDTMLFLYHTSLSNTDRYALGAAISKAGANAQLT